MRFIDRKEVYDQFLEIMKEFKAQRCVLRAVMACVFHAATDEQERCITLALCRIEVVPTLWSSCSQLQDCSALIPCAPALTHAATTLQDRHIRRHRPCQAAVQGPP